MEHPDAIKKLNAIFLEQQDARQWRENFDENMKPMIEDIHEFLGKTYTITGFFIGLAKAIGVVMAIGSAAWAAVIFATNHVK